MNAPGQAGCECDRYPDLANIPMGFDGDDEQFFATISEIARHGGSQWWLWLGACLVCHQAWQVAQDERIFDEYLLQRLDPTAAELIQTANLWPPNFLRFEDVLRELGKRSNFPNWFDLNDSPLVYTIRELMEANPALKLEDAAGLVGLNAVELGKLRLDGNSR